MIKSTILLIFFLIISVFTIFTVDEYVGEAYIFILFSLTSNILLSIGFRKNALFFDTFIGIFLWLGFWFKTTIVLLFLKNSSGEYTGAFSVTGEEFDKALLIASVSFIALIIASLFRERYIFKYPEIDLEDSSLFIFYNVHRKKIIFFYVALFLFIGSTNYYFHIYQRGGISPENIFFVISGIYKWLLLFGLASFAALILKYEFSIKKKSVYFVPILTLVESAITNVSLLSRGMMLNSSALGLGLMRFSYISKFNITIKYWVFIISIMVVIFILSISFANKLRAYSFEQIKQDYTVMETIKSIDITQNTKGIAQLFVGRSVGMEGVLAISAQENLGWNIFFEALNEKYDEHKTSFYDSFIGSGYTNSEERNYHRVSMPGFIAFFYYPGSLVFLFIALLIIALIASTVEILAYKLSKNNQIFSALVAQVIAYRLINFGYVPGQSYLLFGTIFLNIFLIYGADKFLSIWYRQENKV